MGSYYLEYTHRNLMSLESTFHDISTCLFSMALRCSPILGLQHITRPFGNLQALGGGKGASSIQWVGQWMDGCELWMMWDGLPGYKKH